MRLKWDMDGTENRGGGKKDGMETGGGKGETGKCFVMVLKFDKT